MLQARSNPSSTLTMPVATVPSCAPPLNQTGHTSRTFPWRSAKGM